MRHYTSDAFFVTSDNLTLCNFVFIVSRKEEGLKYEKVRR